MTLDQDFYQMVLDFFSIEAQRHNEIMATLSDVQSKLAALNTSLDAKAKASADAHSSLKSAVDKTLADLAATGAAGHAAVLDSIIASIDDTKAKVDGDPLPDAINAMTTDLTKAIGAVPIPAV
jgi:hypothetical protein